MSWHKFGASNQPGTCLWCGRKLRQKYHSTVRSEKQPEPTEPCGHGQRGFTPKCDSTTYHHEYSGKTGRANWKCEHDHDHGPVEKRIVTERKKAYDKPGDYGDGHFCGIRCAYQYGVVLADEGRRLTKKAREEEKKAVAR